MAQAGSESGPAKATRASRVAEDLRRSILRGVPAPGEKVNLDRMRDHFGVSLSPLREAISRLVPAGLVEFEDQRGYRIAPVSEANLAEVIGLRAELESFALSHAVKRAEIDWESAVMGALHRLNRIDAAQAAEAWDTSHAAFHMTLIGGCGLPTLVEFCRVLRDQNERYMRLYGPLPGAGRDMANEHAAIAGAAALNRDAEAARRLLRQHIERTGQELTERFRARMQTVPA